MKAPDGYTWLGENFFKDRQQLATSYNKPIIYEEYGMVASGELPVTLQHCCPRVADAKCLKASALASSPSYVSDSFL